MNIETKLDFSTDQLNIEMTKPIGQKGFPQTNCAHTCTYGGDNIHQCIVAQINIVMLVCGI